MFSLYGCNKWLQCSFMSVKQVLVSKSVWQNDMNATCAFMSGWLGCCAELQHVVVYHSFTQAGSIWSTNQREPCPSTQRWVQWSFGGLEIPDLSKISSTSRKSKDSPSQFYCDIYGCWCPMGTLNIHTHSHFRLSHLMETCILQLFTSWYVVIVLIVNL